MVKLNKIECMDCLKYLKKIPDNFVDLVVTDPPYNVSQKTNINYKDLNVVKNFGDWDFGFDPIPVYDDKELVEFLLNGTNISKSDEPTNLTIGMHTVNEDNESTYLGSIIVSETQ